MTQAKQMPPTRTAKSPLVFREARFQEAWMQADNKMRINERTETGGSSSVMVLVVFVVMF